MARHSFKCSYSFFKGSFFRLSFSNLASSARMTARMSLRAEAAPDDRLPNSREAGDAMQASAASGDLLHDRAMAWACVFVRRGERGWSLPAACLAPTVTPRCLVEVAQESQHVEPRQL